MNTGIDWLLATATGPKRLRQELELKTEPISGLSQMLAKTETLQTVIPNELLGGELLALLSNRLRNALLLAEDLSVGSFVPLPPTSFSPQEETSAIPRDRSAAPASRLAARTVTPNVTPSRAPERDRQMQAPERGATTQMRPLPPAFQTHSSSDPQPEPNEAQPAPGHRVHSGIAPSSPAQPYERPVSESLLVKQLRRYWQLSEPETVSSSPTDTAGMEGRLRPGPSWPLAAFNPFSTRSWPDLIGQMAAQKANHFQYHAHSSGEQSRQTVHADAPENVEIRNVFNIALPGQSDRHDQTDTQLAETIADLLREQALQHGIDLT